MDIPSEYADAKKKVLRGRQQSRRLESIHTYNDESSQALR